MNPKASFFTHLAGYLFNGAGLGGAGSFVASAVAAEFGFPVVAQLFFSIGLIAIFLLIGLAAVALISSARRWLRG